MPDPAELPEINHEALAALLAEPLPTLPAVDWLELPALVVDLVPMPATQDRLRARAG